MIHESIQQLDQLFNTYKNVDQFWSVTQEDEIQGNDEYVAVVTLDSDLFEYQDFTFLRD